MAYKDLKGDCYHHGMCCSEKMAKDCERDYNTGRPYRESSRIQWDAENIIMLIVMIIVTVGLIGGTIVYEIWWQKDKAQSENAVTTVSVTEVEESSA